MTERVDQTSLVCRVQSRWCALPLKHVRETMRPLPIEPLARPNAAGALSGQVLGVALIRGASLPVVDLAALLGLPAAAPQRFVVIAVGERRVALAVTEVLGLREIAASTTEPLPPLLQDSATEAIEAIRWRDAELLLVLDSVQLLPDEALLPEPAP